MDLDSSGAPGPRVAGEAETGCSDRERFLLELEFVQVTSCLSRPGLEARASALNRRVASRRGSPTPIT